MKESASLHRSFIRDSEEAGAIRGTYDRLYNVNLALGPFDDLIWHNLPALGTEIPETHSLLRWQINDNKAIDSCFFAIFQQPLLSVAENRVVVSHEQDWGLQSLLPCLSYHFEG
jgi:hypothetical protein